MEKTNLSPSDVWDYRKKLSIGESIIIAEECDYGVSISFERDEDGNLILSACIDGELVEYTEVNTSDQCRRMVKLYYDIYLTGKFSLLEDNDITETEFERNREVREIELSAAVEDLIMELAPDYADEFFAKHDSDEIVEEIKDDLLSYFAIKHKLPIYRPTVFSKGGEKEMVNYPYNDL